ncbi:SRPBCC domain-containing protein [Chryseobacterium cucumeris]|uniref:SRPBCC domain-containing protein n=1 Tax=Chryseobacterium cucumeris TaxID=1813611 RepID=UPI0021D42A9E|nr:SRPBCC domain-containing protein [Chryseobacterium cucumeris]
MSTPITVQYTINAPAEKVWKALTDKNEMKSWYFDIQDFVWKQVRNSTSMNREVRINTITTHRF